MKEQSQALFCRITSDFCAILLFEGGGNNEDCSNSNKGEMAKSPPGNSTGSGSNLLDLPRGFDHQALQKRPSIAPVPAFLDGNNIDIQVRLGWLRVYVGGGGTAGEALCPLRGKGGGGLSTAGGALFTGGSGA